MPILELLAVMPENESACAVRTLRSLLNMELEMKAIFAIFSSMLFQISHVNACEGLNDPEVNRLVLAAESINDFMLDDQLYMQMYGKSGEEQKFTSNELMHPFISENEKILSITKRWALFFFLLSIGMVSHWRLLQMV